MYNKKKITASSEDYLEAIYYLNQKQGLVRVTDVADELSVSKPSVNRAIKKLISEELVVHETYSEIKLTEKGFIEAKNVTRVHGILKNFLIDILGVDIEIAEKEACAMEHSICEETVNKLAEYIDKVNRKG